MKLTPSLDKFQVALRRELAYHPSVVRHQCLMPTPEEVRSWWIRWPRAAIGMVTGSISGCCVLDIDPQNGGDLQGKSLPAGPCSADRQAIRT